MAKAWSYVCVVGGVSWMVIQLLLVAGFFYYLEQFIIYLCGGVG